MATAAGARAGQPETREAFSVITHQSICSRCGGLMVSDFCMDLLNSTGELEFAAKCCVQCGAVVDPVILHNRQLRQESMPSRSVRRSIQSMECEVGS
jgi:ribosomal protein S27AE